MRPLYSRYEWCLLSDFQLLTLSLPDIISSRQFALSLTLSFRDGAGGEGFFNMTSEEKGVGCEKKKVGSVSLAQQKKVLM